MEAGKIGCVPRTETDEARLLEVRPPGWEYLLYAAVLLRLENALEQKWIEHEQLVRRAGATQFGEAEALDRLSHDVFAEAQAIVQKATDALSPDSVESAFGRPGKAGDPQKIEALAQRVVSAYDGLLEWAAALRAQGVSVVMRPVYDAAAELVELPLQQFRQYFTRTVETADLLPARLAKNEDVAIKETLTLSIDDKSLERFQRALAEATQSASRQNAPALRQDSEASVQPEHPEIPAGLGFFASRRAKKAVAEYEHEFAAWQAMRDDYAERLTLAQTFGGESSADILLKRGESLFAVVNGASLIEDRRGAGHWEGRSSGFSFPIGSIGGRSIRYRTGSSRGTFVQGTPIPTAIDTGNFYVTNQRAIFQGTKQTRECRFDKLVGFQHTTDGATIFSVSNRQKPTQVHYGADIASWVDFRLDLALAHYNDSLPGLVEQVRADLAAVDAARPKPPDF